jgi:(1->4)-alpha-D-glucan 1-alpha-D-glucosylmutase
MTTPGAPDFYQGSELWDLDLVDPDNRRPVDFVVREKLLTEAKTLSAEAAWKNWESGLPKLWIIRQVLALRARRPELFDRNATYEAVEASGAGSGSVVAFKRGGDLLVVVPRLVLRASVEREDTTIDLPAGSWRNEFTEEEHGAGAKRLSELWSKFPVALLVREGDR